MTYRIVRSTHLCAGLLSAVFLLAYAVSAMQMAHFRWFRLEPRVTEWSMAVDASGGARGVAQLLGEMRGVRGELSGVKQEGTGLAFRIARPGVVHQVAVRDGVARVKTSRAGLLGTLNRLHHAAGFRQSDWVYRVWGVWVVAVCASLVLLAGSGVWLWFARNQERRSGAVILLVSAAYALTLIVAIRGA
jgi:hypothetical protein